MEEDIFDKIIQIDEEAKNIIAEEKNKKDNIEAYIQSEFKSQKVILDRSYEDEIDKQRDRYIKLFKEKKESVTNDIKSQMNNILENYQNKETEIVNNIVNNILKGE